MTQRRLSDEIVSVNPMGANDQINCGVCGQPMDRLRITSGWEYRCKTHGVRWYMRFVYGTKKEERHND